MKPITPSGRSTRGRTPLERFRGHQQRTARRARRVSDALEIRPFRTRGRSTARERVRDRTVASVRARRARHTTRAGRDIVATAPTTTTRKVVANRCPDQAAAATTTTVVAATPTTAAGVHRGPPPPRPALRFRSRQQYRQTQVPGSPGTPPVSVPAPPPSTSELDPAEPSLPPMVLASAFGAAHPPPPAATRSTDPPATCTSDAPPPPPPPAS